MKWKKLILINFLSITLLFLIISLVLPKWYKATAVILPPASDTQMGLFSTMMQNLSGITKLPGSSAKSDIYFMILKSRSLKDSVINKFDLIKQYNCDTKDEAIKIVSDNLDFEETKEGAVSVSYTHNDQGEVADITNYIINILDHINTNINIEKARNTRIILERRYLQNLSDLKTAEDSLKAFQQKFGIISLPEQAEISLKAEAEFEVEALTKEVELAVLKKSVNENHPDVLRKENELNELYRVLRANKSGNLISYKSPSSVFIPFNKLPEHGMTFFRLKREVLLQGKLLEFLLPQYEQAKLQEIKDTPTVQVLDPALMPMKKDKPKRVLIVSSAALFSVIFSGFIILIYELFLFIKREYS